MADDDAAADANDDAANADDDAAANANYDAAANDDANYDAPTHDQPAAAGAKAPAKVPKGSPPKPGKAQQWQALVDQTSGNTYYYNDATDESSWNKPAGF